MRPLVDTGEGRFHLCRVQGSGTVEDPYKPVVPPGCRGWVAVAAPDPAARPWMLVRSLEADVEHDGTEDDDRDVSLPPLGMDERPLVERGKVDKIVQRRLGVKLKCAKGATWREVLTEIGRSVDPNFDPDLFRVNKRPGNNV